jgi:DNA repair protein RecO (recombination protein O)
MSNLVREKVIILKKVKYSEADLIVQCLTAQGRKISLLARGALRSKKRFGGGVLEPTHHVEIQYKRPAQEERLATLDDAVLLHDFAPIRTSYERLEAALKVVEAVARVSQHGDVHSEALFNLTGSALKSLEAHSEISIFKIHFGIRFLRQQGVLEQEPWMGPFLKAPMLESESLAGLKLDTKYLHFIEKNLDRYLTQAES